MNRGQGLSTYFFMASQTFDFRSRQGSLVFSSPSTELGVRRPQRAAQPHPLPFGSVPPLLLRARLRRTPPSQGLGIAGKGCAPRRLPGTWPGSCSGLRPFPPSPPSPAPPAGIGPAPVLRLSLPLPACAPVSLHRHPPPPGNLLCV